MFIKSGMMRRFSSAPPLSANVCDAMTSLAMYVARNVAKAQAIRYVLGRLCWIDSSSQESGLNEGVFEAMCIYQPVAL